MKSSLIFSCLILCCGTVRSFALELWATTSASANVVSLSRINIATGAVVSTNAIGSGLATASLDDLASDPVREPSVIWGVRWSAFVNQLVALDPFQNQIISSIQLNSPTPIHSLAIDPTDGVLYGAGGTSLYRITRATGATTLVGMASTSLDNALGFDTAGNLYGVNNNVLLSVDKSTGASNPVATLSSAQNDIAASPESGIMYGLGFGSPNYSLYQINLASGALTTVGPSLLRPSSLAFTAQPSVVGDFNGDTIIDAADYAVWRKRLGTTYTESQYNDWRAHFGQPITSGSSVTLDHLATIPEPLSLVLFVVALSAAGLYTRCR